MEYRHRDAQGFCLAKSWKITANAPLRTKTIALNDTYTLFKAKVKEKQVKHQVTKNVLEKEVTCRFDLGGALGGQLPKGCRERKCSKSFVSFASRSPEVGLMCQLLAMLISGSMVLSPGMFCGRKAGRRRFVRGASKIQIVIKTLGGWA